jgi:mannose-6-phosphate isomerase-like protein (cupin superfamily)
LFALLVYGGIKINFIICINEREIVMEKYLVDFAKIEWVSPGKGIRFKIFEKEGKILRLMELSDTYCDSEWCTHGHISYIIDGQFNVKFESHTENFAKGDTVFIPAGEEHKHIASVPKGKHLIMLSFEI